MILPDGFSGAVEVVRAGEVVFSGAAGRADGATPCTSGTRFQVASISKRVVAAAALLLVDRGLLDLRASITRWFPDAPAAWSGVTPHRLLTHTAGFGHWAALERFDIDHPAPDLFDHILASGLVAEPGSRWSYSGPGYVVAAQLIERIVGTSYFEFATRQVLEPLGMAATTSGSYGAEVGGALGHRGGATVETAAGLASIPGTGDLWSTTADVNVLTKALQTPGLLSEVSTTALSTSYVATGSDDRGPLVAESYGYGCFIGTFGAEIAVVHPGDNPGYRSLAAWLPRRSVEIAVLGNDDSYRPEWLWPYIAALAI